MPSGISIADYEIKFTLMPGQVNKETQTNPSAPIPGANDKSKTTQNEKNPSPGGQKKPTDESGRGGYRQDEVEQRGTAPR
jgi:hypothetical protein